MKLSQELRIGNLLSWEGKVVTLNLNSLIQQIKEESNNEALLTPIPITKEWLLLFGFIEVKKERYINGYQYLFQIDGHHDDIVKEGIDKNGTWFDGIGTRSWEKTRNLAVSSLCRGNYFANNIGYVHELQNLYFALTGNELKYNHSELSKIVLAQK